MMTTEKPVEETTLKTMTTDTTTTKKQEQDTTVKTTTTVKTMTTEAQNVMKCKRTLHKAALCRLVLTLCNIYPCSFLYHISTNKPVNIKSYIQSHSRSTRQFLSR